MKQIPLASAVVLAVGLAGLCLAGWRAAAAPEAPPLGDADRRAATDAVHLFLALSAHLRGTGGDSRYADRLPARPAVVEELSREVEYRWHGGHQEEPRLVRLEIRDVAAAGPEQAAVKTREFWITRELRKDDAPVRSDVVFARYLVEPGAGGWRVVDWDVEEGAVAP
jgi:hypothetical protein